MTLRTLIVDDEPLARKGMEDYVRDTPFLNLVGVCSNASEAEVQMKKGPVELLLLDIQMPMMTGIEFMKSLTHPPMVIFTTAYSEYALEGYELDVIDFLVKPISYERFLKAVTKAKDFHGMMTGKGPSESANYFFVKCNGKFERVYFDDILMVEAMQNYVVIHLASSKLIVYMTLSGMEEQLPGDRFMRVHKSYLVALSKVNAIESHEIVMGQFRIPISRTLLDEVKKRVMGNNLLMR